MRILSTLTACAALLGLMVFGTPAMACHLGSATTDPLACESHTDTGITVPAAEMSQIPVLVNNADDIMRTAQTLSQNPAYDGPQRAVLLDLLTFTQIEYRASFWNLIPSAASNEASVFHTPFHAWTGGLNALLKHMNATAGTQPGVSSLYNRVTLSLLEHNSDIALCSVSKTIFNTAHPVSPHFAISLTAQAQIGLGVVITGIYFAAFGSLVWKLRQRPAALAFA